MELSTCLTGETSEIQDSGLSTYRIINIGFMNPAARRHDPFQRDVYNTKRSHFRQIGS